MNIYFAGAIGAENKDPRLKSIIKDRRLVSYHYMTKSLNKEYFGFVKETEEKKEIKERNEK